MITAKTWLNVFKFEQAMAKKTVKPTSNKGVKLRISKVQDQDGSWHYKLGPAVPQKVKEGLGGIIGALQKRELKTDVLIKENK